MYQLSINQCHHISAGEQVCIEATVPNGVLLVGGIIMTMTLGGAFYALNHSYKGAVSCMAFTSFVAGLVYLFQ